MFSCYTSFCVKCDVTLYGGFPRGPMRFKSNRTPYSLIFLFLNGIEIMSRDTVYD